MKHCVPIFGVDEAPLTATALRRILRKEVSQHGLTEAKPYGQPDATAPALNFGRRRHSGPVTFNVRSQKP
jgi:hypothetical protein